jgi:quercetin dioxygenase-like cupin family protein
LITRAHIVTGAAGETYELGVISLRLMVATNVTDGAFALGEFRGGQGAWTVPHLHRNAEESFYVLDGTFIFTVGDDEIPAGPGSFILVPRGTPHVMSAAGGGGRLLTLWTPGGPEAMFVELSRLPPDSVRDPEVRRLLSARFDSIPV